MAFYEYVSQEQLTGFDMYKYSAVDSNPLSVYVMHPFWNFVVKFLPTWLAPNLITFTGFLFLVLNFLMLAFFDYDFYASAPDHVHVPSWVWIVAGLLNFIAYTLDGVDGKQARRTNSSTPLGELFDHGLDSWACVFFVVTVYSIFGRVEAGAGVGVRTLYYILWVVLFSFILSHWEKYNTGVLFLPWGYDISQVVPRTEEEWRKISEGFEECRKFQRYKNTFSIVLLAVVDADYKFVHVDIGCNGRVSDRGVFNNSTLGQALVHVKLSIPQPTPLPTEMEMLKYVFVADDAFTLKENIMKSYGSHGLSGEKRIEKIIFNYRFE
ncbi:ethanolaminephosphotransferase 1-like isoform X3 [Polyodon spathula]|uniref:ethanolaminephosphotransferase 1-like isoform X3 n=1 Tax=Polyodon spathula TaxID=7913 RepID=UPI001B7DA0D9|nr:ethanolaminephosphotransferase 1-like isoform X3 [Polyodon spathula]